MHVCNQGLHCELCDETCSSYIEVMPVQTYKEAISDLIYKELGYIYCDSCRYRDEEGWCDSCHRKYMDWGIARYTCDELAERIINLKGE